MLPTALDGAGEGVKAADFFMDYGAFSRLLPRVTT